MLLYEIAHKFSEFYCKHFAEIPKSSLRLLLLLLIKFSFKSFLNSPSTLRRKVSFVKLLKTLAKKLEFANDNLCATKQSRQLARRSMETCRSCACQHVTCVNVCFENICGISRHLKRIYFILLFTVALTGENYCLQKLVSMCTIFIRRSSARCQRSSATPTTELGGALML